MLRHTAYLSVRQPLAGAVYIPPDALEQRAHELPPPHREVLVVSGSLEAYYALGWLHARGRRARLADPPRDADPSVRYRLWEPNAWLQEVIESADFVGMRCGTPSALDLGCGSGREAVYLADRGWRVVAVDRLPDALARGRDLQHRYAPDSPPIQWVCADLEKQDWQPERTFALITLFYFFSRTLLQRATAWLEPGGALLVEAFTTTHRAHYGKPASDERVARPDELPMLLSDTMQVVHYSEGWRSNGRHTARLWAKRV